MTQIKQLPARSEVNPADTWDLSSLFPSDDAWESGAAATAWIGRIGEYADFQGKLGESPESLAACLQFDLDLDRIAEALGNYAFLKTAEDVGESKYQRMQGRYMNVGSRAAQAASFIRPEILAIPAATMNGFLKSSAIAPYKLILQRVLRYKPHTLGPKEENLLAMQTEMAQAANQVFRQLNDADLKFGNLTNHEGQVVELSHATFSALLHVSDRAVRRGAFQQYYREYSDHAHTLAASLAGSMQGDILLRQGAPELSRALALEWGIVSRPGADHGLRQSHRVGASAFAVRSTATTRRAAAEDEAQGHPPVRLPTMPIPRPTPAAKAHVGREAVEGRWSSRSRPLGKRLLRDIGKRSPRPLVRPLRKPQQAERRLQLRHVRRRSLHSHELPGGRAGPRLHAHARGGPFDAQLAFRPAPAVCLLPLHDLRRRGGQHVQRTALEQTSFGERGQRPRAGVSHQPPTGRHAGDHLPPDDVRRVREAGPSLGRVGRAAHAGPLPRRDLRRTA